MNTLDKITKDTFINFCNKETVYYAGAYNQSLKETIKALDNCDSRHVGYLKSQVNSRKLENKTLSSLRFEKQIGDKYSYLSIANIKEYCSVEIKVYRQENFSAFLVITEYENTMRNPKPNIVIYII